MRKPRTYGSVADALAQTARLYRRDLWARSPWRVEVWAESDSIGSTLYEVTERWDVPLMTCRGQTSETFAWSAVEAWRDHWSLPVVLYVGDHDPAGLEIEASLREKLDRFSRGLRIEWERIGVTWEQAESLDLPGTTPKKPYGYPLSVEAEALPPNNLREMLDDAIVPFVDHHELEVLLTAEEQERTWLQRLARHEVVS
jgi:hypothetical protein